MKCADYNRFLKIDMEIVIGQDLLAFVFAYEFCDLRQFF